jgi:hypothetical protein
MAHTVGARVFTIVHLYQLITLPTQKNNGFFLLSTARHKAHQAKASEKHRVCVEFGYVGRNKRSALRRMRISQYYYPA